MLREKFKYWITLEEHGIVGGLGSSILEWASDYEHLNSIKIKRLAVKSEFIHQLGNQAYTRNILGLDCENIVKFIKEL